MTKNLLTLDDPDPTLQNVLDDVRMAMGVLGEAGENLHQLKRLVEDADDIFHAIDKVNLAWAAAANAVGAIKEAGQVEPPVQPVQPVPGLVPDEPAWKQHLQDTPPLGRMGNAPWVCACPGCRQV